MKEKKKKHLTTEQKEKLKNTAIGVGIGLGTGGLIAIPVVCAITRKHNSGIWSDFTNSGGPMVYNNKVTEMVKKHSRFWDRLNPGRMVDMSFMAFDILNGSVKEPKKNDWKFKFHRNNDGEDIIYSDAPNE